MLGHRGSRLAVTAPEIYAMQLRALFGAMQDVAGPEAATVEIMLPLISTAGEITRLRQLIETEAAAWGSTHGFTPEFSVGSMIEVPGAALTADTLAQALADQPGFFSFGTNDLTQTTLGLSRDDAGSFLSDYLAAGLFEADPFATLAQDSVGALMQITAEKARAVSPELKLGLCGEHGGDPASVAFCDAAGLDYVSCSPFRCRLRGLRRRVRICWPCNPSANKAKRPFGAKRIDRISVGFCWSPLQITLYVNRQL